MIALFSLVGAIGRQGIATLSFAPHRFWCAFCPFSIALAATLITGVCVYFTQMFFARATAYQQWIAQSEMLGGTPKDEWRVDLPKATAVAIGLSLRRSSWSRSRSSASLLAVWALASVRPAS